MGRKVYIGVAAAVALAAALAWLPLTQPFTRPLVQPSEKAPGVVRLIVASVRVEGRGTVLANGTSTLTWNSTRPFLLTLEAKPEKCWLFKEWLVNGSRASSDSVLALTVAGNTTVAAVFEAPLYTVTIVPVFTPFYLKANASARVNGTLYALPAEVQASLCSILEIAPVAPRGWVALNGTLLVTVNGNANLSLFFEKVAALLRLGNLLAPVKITGTINGTPVELVVGGPKQLEVELAASLGSNVTVGPAGDKRGCASFNETHRVCIGGWVVDGYPYPSPWLALTAAKDVLAEALVTLEPREYPVIYTEVVLPNGSRVKVPVIPDEENFLVPFYCKYEYVGDGWLRVEGWMEYRGFVAYSLKIVLPESWKKVRVVINYTRVDPRGGATLYVACKNLMAGVALAPSMPGTRTNVFIIDREFVDCVGDTPFDPTPNVPEHWYVLGCLAKHFISVEDGGGPTIAGTSASKLGVPPGSLVLDGSNGIIYLKIEILEMEERGG